MFLCLVFGDGLEAHEGGRVFCGVVSQEVASVVEVIYHVKVVSQGFYSGKSFRVPKQVFSHEDGGGACGAVVGFMQGDVFEDNFEPFCEGGLNGFAGENFGEHPRVSEGSARHHDGVAACLFDHRLCACKAKHITISHQRNRGCVRMLSGEGFLESHHTTLDACGVYGGVVAFGAGSAVDGEHVGSTEEAVARCFFYVDSIACVAEAVLYGEGKRGGLSGFLDGFEKPCLVFEDGASAAGPDDFFHRAAHVDVDGVEALSGEDAHGLFDFGARRASDLDTENGFVGVACHHFEGAFVFVADGRGREHFDVGESGSEFLANTAEGDIGNASQGGQEHAVGNVQRTDGKGARQRERCHEMSKPGTRGRESHGGAWEASAIGSFEEFKKPLETPPMPPFPSGLKSRFVSLFGFCRRVLIGLAPLCLLPVYEAKAGDWGLTVAYNNPAGANIGANLMYLGQVFAFEVGVGGVAGDAEDGNADGDADTAKGGLWGDVDIKVLFGQKWRPYLEAGFGMALGAGLGKGSGVQAGAGSPFAGGGLMYVGSPLLFYVAGDYTFESQDLFPVVGLGVKF